jgi:hypothetical protein
MTRASSAATCVAAALMVLGFATPGPTYVLISLAVTTGNMMITISC